MGKNNFDKHIKDRLEELDMNYDPSSWDAFEQKLDNALSQEEIDNAAFDEQIKEKVHNELSFGYEEEHWQELSSRIDHENQLTNRIYSFKIAELFILVLLAYSFFQIEDIKDPKKNLPLMAHSEIFKSIEKKHQQAELLAATSITQDNLTQSIQLSAESALRENFDLISLDRIALTPLSISEQEANASLPNYLALHDQVAIESIDNEITTLDFEQNIELRENINVNLLSAEEAIITSPKVDLNKPEKWLSFSGSADINLVNTPASFLFNSRRDQLLGATGLSSRLSYAIKSGRNEYEIGIGYSYKSYDPAVREVFNADTRNSSIANASNPSPASWYAYSLNKIEFHIAQIPAYYKRYLVDNRSWSAYAAIGATHNFIMFSDYQLSEELLRGIWSPKDYRKANSDLLRRDYYTGLFQNVDQPSNRRSSSKEFQTEGSLFDNTFITSYAGLGIQKNLGTDRSIFLQTGYHHQFFGDKLGPNKDQINTFSFTLGGKFRI